jgi:hypothetical protein
MADKMRLESLKNQTTEIFVDGYGVTVTCNPWANGEGMSLMVHGKDLSLRMAGAFRWEELDVITVALSAARTA